MQLKCRSPILIENTTSSQYVNLILIILGIFLALIRGKSTEVNARNVTEHKVASYSFSSSGDNSAALGAIGALLKQHDLGADVVVFGSGNESERIAEITTYFEEIGVPFSAYKLFGRSGKRQQVNVTIYRMERSSA